MIRLARPDIDETDVSAVADVLRGGQLVQGPVVKQFEAICAPLAGCAHAVAVANGTAALQLALQALGIGPGDQVAIPTFSWPATANVVVLRGAVPVFVEIEQETMGMDPRALGAVLSERRGIRAVIAVHAFGRMARIEELVHEADARGVPLIEDAACALGAERRGRPAGSWGRMGCFSFHPRKAATTGEGGVVSTDDAALARSIRVLRNHGLDPEASVPDFIDAGHNLRLTELQAALGVSQLRKYGAILARRSQLATHYGRLLADLALQLPDPGERGEHVWQSYVVRLPQGAAKDRSAIIASLRDLGVESTIGTHHIPLLSYFRRVLGHHVGDFPIGEDVAARALAIPLHSALSDDDQRTVAAALRKVLAQ